MILEKLESKKSSQSSTLGDDLPLFSAIQAQRPDPKQESKAEAALDKINPDSLTPLQALEELYKLKSLIAGDHD